MRRTLWNSALLIVVVVASLPDIVGAQSFESELVSQARQAERYGRIQEAEKLYRRILDHNGLNQQAHHRLGVISAQRGNFDEAIDHFELAEQLGAPSAQLLSDYGGVLYLNDELEAAERKLRVAITLDSGNKAAQDNLKLLQQKLVMLKEARTQAHAQARAAAYARAIAEARVEYETRAAAQSLADARAAAAVNRLAEARSAAELHAAKLTFENSRATDQSLARQAQRLNSKTAETANTQTSREAERPTNKATGVDISTGNPQTSSKSQLPIVKYLSPTSDQPSPDAAGGESEISTSYRVSDSSNEDEPGASLRETPPARSRTNNIFKPTHFKSSKASQRIWRTTEEDSQQATFVSLASHSESMERSRDSTNYATKLTLRVPPSSPTMKSNEFSRMNEASKVSSRRGEPMPMISSISSPATVRLPRLSWSQELNGRLSQQRLSEAHPTSQPPVKKSSNSNSAFPTRADIERHPTKPSGTTKWRLGSFDLRRIF